MLRSKSRSGSIDFGQRSHSSRFSRTFSASKLCRGDALGCQIDSNAVVSLDRKKPSKVDNLSEIQVNNRVLLMKEQMGHVEEELRETKKQLDFVEDEKNKAILELKEMKRLANEANMKLNEGLSSKKAGELIAEVKVLKEFQSKTQEELKIKDKNIESLRVELERAKKYEVKLAEKDVVLGGLREEMNNVKASEVKATEQLSVFKKKVEELEVELEKRKLSESKIFDSFESQTRQFERAKIELEEAKVEMASLYEKVESLEAALLKRRNSGRLNGYSNGEIANSVKKELESLNSELALAKEDVANAQEREKIALSKAKNLNDEISLLKNEVKLASEAEEKSRKAMDDLALALKEVATEASEAKEKLSAAQLELEQVKEEAGQLKEMIRNTEARYGKLLDEAKKEADLYRNTAERLRLETEESLLAWNGKEMGFITCIKRAEEELTLAQRETERLAESLKAAEDTSRAAKEEKYKLRDILKQAINEANAAKAAAGLARDENSQLKDRLAEKEEALHFITKENERLRINGLAASHDNVKVLASSSPESRTSPDRQQQGGTKTPTDMIEECEEYHNVKETFSVDLRELKFEKAYDPEKEEALKGSIFDPTSVTPKSEPRTPHSLPQRRRASSPALGDEAGKPNANLDFNHFDDSDSDRNHPSSRRRALFRKVGDLIMRKSFHV